MTYDRYSTEEEILNSLTHIVGTYVAVVFTTLMYVMMHLGGKADQTEVLSVLIYGISMTAMFTMSASYHAIQYVPAKMVLKVLDHISIYFAIAGMCTPICLVVLRDDLPALCWSLLIVQWLSVAVGTVFKVFTTGRYRTVSTVLYLILGWMMVVALFPIMARCTARQVGFLVSGGVLYTVGSIFYMMKGVKYTHCIWHVFVLLASIFHFMFMLSII